MSAPRLAAAAATLVLLAATPLAAQDETRPNPMAGRIGGGITALYGAPQDEFKEFIDQGWGIGGNLLFKLDPAGVLALRLDAGWMNYGNTRSRVPLSPTTGNLILVDLNTSHNIFLGGAGLQLQAPTGPIRPYVGGTAGFATFWTQSSVEGSDNEDQPFATTTNQRDNTFAWSGVGGVTIPLTAAGNLLLDAGVTYQANGEATYLPPGVIRDANDVPIVRDPVRSTTDMFVYRLGVRFGF